MGWREIWSRLTEIETEIGDNTQADEFAQHLESYGKTFRQQLFTQFWFFRHPFPSRLVADGSKVRVRTEIHGLFAVFILIIFPPLFAILYFFESYHGMPSNVFAMIFVYAWTMLCGTGNMWFEHRYVKKYLMKNLKVT